MDLISDYEKPVFAKPVLMGNKANLYLIKKRTGLINKA
jgi:hypothetical protein